MLLLQIHKNVKFMCILFSYSQQHNIIGDRNFHERTIFLFISSRNRFQKTVSHKYIYPHKHTHTTISIYINLNKIYKMAIDYLLTNK